MNVSCYIKPLSKRIQWIQTILVFIMIALQIVPQLKTFSFYKLSWLFAMILWFTIIVIHRPIFFFKIDFLLKVMLFFMAYTILVPYFFGNDSIGNRYLSLSQIPVFYIIYNFNVATLNKKTNYNLIKWSIPLIFFTVYTTLKQLIIDPTISRQIKSGGEETLGLWRLGIGGYDFIYFLTFITIIISSLLFLIKFSLKNKILFIIILSIVLSVIVLSNYFTAIIMLFTSFIVFHVIKDYSVIKLFLLFVVFIIVVFFGDLIAVVFIDSIISFLSEGKNIVRLNLLKEYLVSNNVATELLSQRDGLVLESLNGFIEHPILGIIVNPINFKNFFSGGFGQHSQFADTLSLFGVVGFFQIYFIVKPFFIRVNDGVNLRAFTLSILISVLIIYTFNNSAPLIGFALFFIYPSVYDWAKERLSDYT